MISNPLIYYLSEQGLRTCATDLTNQRITFPESLRLLQDWSAPKQSGATVLAETVVLFLCRGESMK